MDNVEDVKVYIVGVFYCYVEICKFLVVDGIVWWNIYGKEIWYVMVLSFEEKEVVSKIFIIFG